MKSKKIASIIALIFASIVLFLQFVRASVIAGDFIFVWQLPMIASDSASHLTIIESVIAILIPAVLVVFCGLLVFEELRKEPLASRLNLYLRLMIIPVALLAVSAMQKTLYIYLYEGAFSIEFTWLELLTSITLIVIYALTIYEKFKSGYWLIITCLTLIIVEVIRLSIPDISYAYTIGNNVYISTFASSVLFYFSYLFIGLSFILYHRNRKENSF